jgi:hypothetical protein
MVQVLEADRERCWQPLPYRGGDPDGYMVDPTRTPLSVLAQQLLDWRRSESVVGGINADFFYFAPNGVPQGPHIVGGFVLAGPGARVAFAVDSTSALHATRFHVRGFAAGGADTLVITAWNRWSPTGLAYYDHFHGRIDSLRASVVLQLSPSMYTAPTRARWIVERVDSAPPASLPGPIPLALLVLGRDAPLELRARVLAFGQRHLRDSLRPNPALVDMNVALAPFRPRAAVGGQGVLLRDGAIPAAVDSTGAASFARARHPRSAVGWDASGRRLLLVTVDGRQPGYSAGATLRELARIMRALGASDALNLDGGGSTTLVLGRRASGREATVEVLNSPSDREDGRVVERPIANALMIARRCER